jgi:hypothetical protein
LIKQSIGSFINIFKDEVALQCLRNTVVFTFITVPAGMILSLFLAVLLDSSVKFKKIYRAAFFLPSITSWVAIAVVWQWLYNPEFGLINYFLSFFGVPPIQWLTTSKLSLISVCIVCIWKNAGYSMLLFLAGLQNISTVFMLGVMLFLVVGAIAPIAPVVAALYDALTGAAVLAARVPGVSVSGAVPALLVSILVMTACILLYYKQLERKHGLAAFD